MFAEDVHVRYCCQFDGTAGSSLTIQFPLMGIYHDFGVALLPRFWRGRYRNHRAVLFEQQHIVQALRKENSPFIFFTPLSSFQLFFYIVHSVVVILVVLLGCNLSSFPVESLLVHEPIMSQRPPQQFILFIPILSVSPPSTTTLFPPRR